MRYCNSVLQIVGRFFFRATLIAAVNGDEDPENVAQASRLFPWMSRNRLGCFPNVAPNARKYSVLFPG